MMKACGKQLKENYTQFLFITLESMAQDAKIVLLVYTVWKVDV